MLPRHADLRCLLHHAAAATISIQMKFDLVQAVQYYLSLPVACYTHTAYIPLMCLPTIGGLEQQVLHVALADRTNHYAAGSGSLEVPPKALYVFVEGHLGVWLSR